MIEVILIAIAGLVIFAGRRLAVPPASENSLADRVARGTCRSRMDIRGKKMADAVGRALSIAICIGRLLVKGNGSGRLCGKLAAAGFVGADKVAAYRGTQVLFIAAPVLAWPFLNGDLPSKGIFCLALVVTSGMLPGMFVARKARLRKEACETEFPRFMRLLVLSISAGTGFDQALRDSVRDGRRICPVISREMETALDVINAGGDRGNALYDVSEHLGSQDVDRLVRVVLQAGRSGGGLAGPVAELAKAAEETRRFRAEAQMEKLPIKMIPVVALFVFIPCLAVIVGPIFIQFIQAVGRM